MVRIALRGNFRDPLVLMVIFENTRFLILNILYLKIMYTTFIAILKTLENK